MKARVFEAQADLFEVGVLSQTADVQVVSADQLLTAPSGPPVVIVGGLLVAERLGDTRKLASVLGLAGTAVVLVPPFTDLDLGRYFETQVQLRAERRSAEVNGRIVDGAAALVLGKEVKVRSDHFFETALGAGVIAVDAQSKPVLIRYQSTNTSGPVFFSTLQLLTYTALTDEGQRQATLDYLFAWAPASASKPAVPLPPLGGEATAQAVGESILVPMALLVAVGGLQPAERLRSRARALLGTDLSAAEVEAALAELGRQGHLPTEGAEGGSAAGLLAFLEHRGMHAYLRELADLLPAEETER